MLSVAIFGGNRVDGGMIDPGERVFALSLFGGIDLDFASVPPPPLTEVVIIAVFGGATVRVRPDQEVRLTGFSVFGGRSVEPRRQLLPPEKPPPPQSGHDDPESELPLDVVAYAIFGGVSIKRQARSAT